MLRLMTLTLVLSDVLGLTGLACAADATATANDPRRVATLIRQLGADKFQDREAASRALEAAGAEALEPLRQAANSTDLEVARRAAEIIPIVERNVEIATLIQILAASPETQQRWNAADKLRRHGKHAAAAFPVLWKVAQNDQTIVADAALRALGRVDPERAIPKLIELAKNPATSSDLFQSTALALAGIGTPAGEAVPALIEALDRKQFGVRREAARALGYIGGDHPKLVPALLKALNDADLEVRFSAVEALGRLPQLPADSIPALIEFLEKHQSLQLKSLSANRQKLLELQHNDHISTALQVLGRFGSDAKGAVPILIDILKDEKFSRGAHVDALTALERIGPSANEAVPLLNDLAAGRMYGGNYAERAKLALRAILKPKP
ncbi:MAG: HEAT repeat domain-containing protein [Planctomycetia bacterium]|nr:HEAT repeat domain-containing protein [Planctomycetia bacterium]